MSTNLITVARLDSPTQAVEMRTLLETAGLKVTLVEGPAARRDGSEILVQVSEDDFEHALALLNDKSSAVTACSRRMPTRTAAADEADDDMKVTRREKLARRAFRSAIFGFMFPPLWLYSLWVLFEVLASRGKLEGRYRGYTFATAGLFLAPLALLAFAFLYDRYLGDPDADMAQYDRPEVLVGTWRQEPVGAARVLRFEPSGDLQLRVAGDRPEEVQGRWGYDDRSQCLILRLRPKSLSAEKKGQTEVLSLVKFAEQEMILLQQNERVVYRRR